MKTLTPRMRIVLQSLESVSTERYTKSSEILMIDIRKELQERMEALNKEKIESPR